MNRENSSDLGFSGALIPMSVFRSAAERRVVERCEEKP